MALSLPLSVFKLQNVRKDVGFSRNCYFHNSSVRCMVGSSNSNPIVVRRSANYQPTIWDYEFVKSLRNEFEGESCKQQTDELKKDVKEMMLRETMSSPLNQLELIDTVQRLGLGYHFESEIKKILGNIYNRIEDTNENKWLEEDLHFTALLFRLFRQHGYKISPRVFNVFMDEMGNFKACLCEDIEGLLSLYEASYLLEEGEDILEVAREFAAAHLNKYTQVGKDQYLLAIIAHSLELPLHWRVLRLESRWYIDAYERKRDMNPLLHELAKLDFNYVQATHQDDLKYAARSWRNTGLGEKLSFARDRIVESFLWTIGIIFEPQFGYCRRMLAKIIALLTIIDDVYDVYGTIDELELFTNAVERWDVNAMDQLPDYMKICFLTLFNSINEMAFDVLRDRGIDVICLFKKAWLDLCKSYLLEAKWYNNGYMPSFQEYMDNAWISISTPVILVHAYFLVESPITNSALECLKEYPNIIRWSAMILRLADDLGTSSDELKRGDVPKSIQCYMNETGASEEEAREHIKYFIGEIWTKMNKDRVLIDSPLSKTYIGTTVNFARMAQCMYQYGDGHGIPDGETKDRVLSLLVQPIPMDN